MSNEQNSQNSDIPKKEFKKGEAQRRGPSRRETQRREIPKKETKNIEIKKINTQKRENPRSDYKKREPLKRSTQKREAPKRDTQKREPLKKETQKIEAKKRDSPNSGIQKKESKNYNTKSYKKKPYFKKQTHKDFISAIVPVLNEEESLPEFGMLLERELRKLSGMNYEIIYIDDGSTDNSFEIIKKLRERNNRIKAFRFRRNYGKSAALSLGFKEARGELIVTLDADLQDDPTEIKMMIDEIKQGHDLVTGWKKKRHDPFTKVIPSRFFNWVTSIVSGIKLHDFNCGLKVYRKELAKSLQLYGEIYRYIPALANWEGFKVTEVPVKHHRRKYGKSKFGSSRLIKGFLDLVTVVFTTRYLKRPLHFFGTIGTIFAMSGFAIDLYLLIEWMMGLTALSNRPLTLLGIALIIVGVQFFSIGLIGEMIVKNFHEKATYSIKERL